MVDYGRDMSCTTSLKTGRFVSGVRLVAEACYRRLTTPRGTLRGGEDESNYGLDLTAIIGRTDARSVEASLPGRIRSELEKDERIESVAVDMLVTTDAGRTTFGITVQCVTGEGPFELQLLASDVTVELLGITE
ncbi:MAG TPA: hypothetical protein VNJ04_05145 [Gemmatimonadaceae bacterium]|nr:hypothetical protein [Gemmatimonadaceae bacterium]